MSIVEYKFRESIDAGIWPEKPPAAFIPLRDHVEVMQFAKRYLMVPHGEWGGPQSFVGVSQIHLKNWNETMHALYDQIVLRGLPKLDVIAIDMSRTSNAGTGWFYYALPSGETAIGTRLSISAKLMGQVKQGFAPAEKMTRFKTMEDGLEYNQKLLAKLRSGELRSLYGSPGSATYEKVVKETLEVIETTRKELAELAATWHAHGHLDSKVVSKMYDTIIHEYGHLLHMSISKAVHENDVYTWITSGRAGEMIKGFFGSERVTANWAAEKMYGEGGAVLTGESARRATFVSEYAKATFLELFAESYAMYMGGAARRLPKEFLELVEDAIELALKKSERIQKAGGFHKRGML